jgi:hypothetical protein
MNIIKKEKRRGREEFLGQNLGFEAGLDLR